MIFWSPHKTELGILHQIIELQMIIWYSFLVIVKINHFRFWPPITLELAITQFSSIADAFYFAICYNMMYGFLYAISLRFRDILYRKCYFFCHAKKKHASLIILPLAKHRKSRKIIFTGFIFFIFWAKLSHFFLYL